MDAIALGLIKKYIDQKFSNSSSEAATYQAAVQNHFEGLGTVVNVLTKNINNDGTLTDLSLALRTNATDTIYYFPKGTYRIEGFSFNGAHNVTIYAPEAKFVYNSTGQQTSILKFINCENIKLVGGVFDGDNLVQNGLSFNNCPNTTIQDTYIHNIGNADLGYTAGIDFVNDCGHTILTNVKVDNVQAGKVTLIGDAGYIFATGIRFKAGSSGYSKDVLIDHPIISNIGYLTEGNEKIYYVPATKNGTLYYVDNNACVKDIITDEGYNGTGTAKARIDGDGIHFAQRPDEVADREGKTHAVIRNPQITNCAKRALKIATRCVEIDGGNIDISSWSTAVGFQYTGGSIIKNTTIRNNTYTCMTVLADGKMTVDNCTFLSTDGAGNGLALTFEQKFNDTQGNPINPLPENLMITGCHFEDVNHPIIAMLTSVSERKVDSNSIKIENCEFGYFKGEATIYLHPNRFNSIRSLSIKDNIFTYESSIADMHADNLVKYGEGCSETQQVLYLGTEADGSHVDPTELIEVDNSALAEDFDIFFRLFRFTARRKFLGGTPARADWVFEYPEMLNITTGTYESDFGTGDLETFCTCEVDSAGGITAYAHAKESMLRTLIPITPVTFETGEIYDLVSIAQNSDGESLVLDAGITVRLYNAAKQEITAARGALNQAERRIILSSLSATAAYVSIACSPQQKSDGTWIGQDIPEDTKIFVSLKSRKPVIQGSQGRDGMSAYEIAVDNGFEGTESEWLDSLEGADWVPTAAEKSAIAAEAATLIDVSGKEDKTNKVTSIGSSPTDTQYPSAAAVKSFVEGKGYLQSHQDISGKADKATTLSGYGITDAYTKSETEDAIMMGLNSGNIGNEMDARLLIDLYNTGPVVYGSESALLAMTNGYYNSSGQIADHAAYKHTEIFEVIPGTTLQYTNLRAPSSSTPCIVCFQDGVYSSGDSFVPGNTNYASGSFSIPANINGIALVSRPDANYPISVVKYDYICKILGMETALNELGELSESLITEKTVRHDSSELTWENGYISKTDGSIASHSKYHASELIEVIEGTTVTYQNLRAPASSYPLLGCYTANDRSTYLSSASIIATGTDYVSGSFTVPTGVKYISVCAFDLISSTYPISLEIVEKANRVMELENAIENAGLNPWSGKNWYAFGTSITSTNNTLGETNSPTGKYPPYLCQLSGLLLHDYAIAGGTIGTDGIHGGTSNILSRITGTDLSGADLITIEGFVNDFACAVAIGALGDTGNTTMYGAITQAVSYCLQHSDATVVLITESIGRSYNNADYRTTRKNSLDLTQNDYNEVIRQVGKFLGVPVIDAGAKSQINEYRPEYLYDHIHHSELGGKQYAETIWDELKNIHRAET